MKARLEFRHDERVAFVFLAAPKANILDRDMDEALDRLFASLEDRRDLRAIVLTADGPHFSFGASIQEHLPHEIGGALERLSNLLRRVAKAPAPTIAAIRGQCLGGALELALACDLILAEEGSQLGIPEIKLAVFPPAASALLPVRLGVANATDMVLTGRSWSGVEARQRGLVARTTPDGTLDQALESWLDEDFLPRSPSALRFATTAIRARVIEALERDLPRFDRLYLDELMNEPDALEGIEAFIEKRPPVWRIRETVS